MSIFKFTLVDLRRIFEQVKERLNRPEPLGVSVTFRINPSLDLKLEEAGNKEIEKRIGQICGIIDSMTPAERRQPAIIDFERLQRISRGSGVTLLEVSDLLQRYNAASRCHPSRWL